MMQLGRMPLGRSSMRMMHKLVRLLSLYSSNSPRVDPFSVSRSWIAHQLWKQLWKHIEVSEAWYLSHVLITAIGMVKATAIKFSVVFLPRRALRPSAKCRLSRRVYEPCWVFPTCLQRRGGNLWQGRPTGTEIRRVPIYVPQRITSR